MFVEDQTILDIEKKNKIKSKHSDDLIDLSSVSLTQPSTQIENEVQDDQFVDTNDGSEQVEVDDSVHE